MLIHSQYTQIQPARSQPAYSAAPGWRPSKRGDVARGADMGIAGTVGKVALKGWRCSSCPRAWVKNKMLCFAKFASNSKRAEYH